VNKYVPVFLLLLISASVFGQKKSIVRLIDSKTMESYKGPNGQNIIKVHNGVFTQDFSVVRSDSALFYKDLNMVDAFGHVNINQGDTLNIYSDKLNYNGNTKIAILTDNVKMIDKDATLTTNYFTYNTATRIGVYTGGGKLVNKDNTLISKNGYYFANTRDEYFRYNVVCTTPDAVIKTDTLRYNSGSRIAYFYGPTHILGKDKDTLYTENGTYNTITEQAFFGKNNLYSQGTKTLKGDSLFYDRLKGYGRAIKHVTSYDSEQKVTIKGDLGEYYKSDERTVMTQNPYMIFETQDTAAVAKPDTGLKNIKAITANITAGRNNLKKDDPANKKLTIQGKADSVIKKLPPDVHQAVINKTMTLGAITDSITKKTQASASAKNPSKKQLTAKAITHTKAVTDSIRQFAKKPDNIRHDSLLLVADTLETQILTVKDLRELKAKREAYLHRDTSIKFKKITPIVYKKSPKFLSLDPPAWDNHIPSLIHQEVFSKFVVHKETKAPPKPVKLNPVKPVVKDTAQKKVLIKPVNALSDTSRIRIVTAHHHAKLFKSDLQAKADSMFYSSADSTIRCYINPIIWTQESQLSGDTINLQMKNKKLDNLDMFPSAFIVNVEKKDSTHFNQVGGLFMHGTFKNNKLSSMLVVGNAETIYFNRDTVKNTVSDMAHSVSGKILATFTDGQMNTSKAYENFEGHDTPIAKVKDDDKILKGFIWKPKERPLSKEALLNSYHAKQPAKGTTVKKTTPVKKGTVKKGAPLTIQKPNEKMVNDSTLKKDNTVKKDSTVSKQVNPVKKDSTLLKNVIPVKKDTTKLKSDTLKKK
jgi:lipopolysaccharide export system protein LptA